MTRAANEVEDGTVLGDEWTHAHLNYAADAEKSSLHLSENSCAKKGAPTTKSGSVIIALLNDFLSEGDGTSHPPR
jgi:hypothetical protein